MGRTVELGGKTSEGKSNCENKMSPAEAEAYIKKVIAESRYGIDYSVAGGRQNDLQVARHGRNLIYAANYADGTTSDEISSIVFELQGTPPKGMILARVSGAVQSSQNRSERILQWSVLDIEGVRGTRVLHDDKLSDAINIFIKEKGIPLEKEWVHTARARLRSE